MPGPNEPTNETIRVDVPLPTQGKSPDPNIKSRETVRIQLPVRETMGKLPLHNPTELPPGAGSASGSAPEPIFAAVISLGDACASVAGFWTEKGNITRAACIGATCFPGADEKSADAHATRCSAEFLNRGRVAREKLNAAVVDTPRRFGPHFDYSDLDLSFLKQWTIPILSISMNPILTAK